jgi:UDP-glucose 4-epimerase
MSSQPAEPVPDGQDKQASAAPRRPRRPSAAGLTVAVTGPTGAIGRSVIRALESDTQVDRILGMARRPLDTAALGWRKTEYRQGDVQDRHAVDEFVADADVVVHLAFAIMGSREQSGKINLTGSRNVFEAAVAAPRPHRLIHTSSLAAYGYHADNPLPLTEDVPARGSPEHYYSAHKAKCEAILAEVTAGHDMQVYVLRPCVVVGPDSDLANSILRLDPVLDLLPGPSRDLLTRLPLLRPVLPNPGVPFQLVHEEDVASAVLAATLGAAPPGAYNLAGDGEITISDVASALGMYSVPVPNQLLGVASRLVAALPWLPSQAEWIHAIRYPMLMDTTRAHRDLGWVPKYTTREAFESVAR